MSLKFEVHIPDNPAPGHTVLNEADIQYISDKLIHTRAAYCICSACDRVSSDYSKLFEAGKTILHSVRYLLEIFSFYSVELYVHHHKRSTECKCVVYFNNQPFVLSFVYDQNNPPEPLNKTAYELVISQGVKNILCQRVYTLNDNGIMSYDMNFPSPAEFVQNIYQALTQ